MIGQHTFQSLPTSLNQQQTLLRNLLVGGIFRGHGINPCLYEAYQKIQKDQYTLSVDDLSSLINMLYKSIPVVHPLLAQREDTRPQQVSSHSTAESSLSNESLTPEQGQPISPPETTSASTLPPAPEPSESPQGKIAHHEAGLLMAAMTVYLNREDQDIKSARKRGVEVSGHLPGWGERSEKISGRSIQRLEDGVVTDRIYWSLWKGLYLYFRIEAADPENPSFEEAQFWESVFWRSICQHNGWMEEPLTPEGRLLALARRGVALCFGGRLPSKTSIPGVPNQKSASPLTRWLQGEPIVFGCALSKKGFWAQVRALLIGLKIPRKNFEEDLKQLTIG